MGKVRDKFHGMVGFKAGLRCKVRVNSAFIDVITEIVITLNLIKGLNIKLVRCPVSSFLFYHLF